ncbi:MAG: oligosaccharide flippase family protein, partial [Pseudomonadota bacterium]
MSQSTKAKHTSDRPVAALIGQITGWQRDLVLSVMTQLIQKFPGLFAAVILARHFDKDLIGQFFFCGVIGSIAATASHLGTDRELRRSVAQRPEDALDMLGQILPLRLATTLLLWICINLAVALLAPDLLQISALTTAYLLVGDLFYTFSAVFVGFRWMGLRLAVGAIGPLLISVSSLAVLQGWSLASVLGLYIVANAIMVAVAARVMHAHVGPVRLQWRLDTLRPVLLVGLPFLATEMVLLLQSKVDVLMIFALSTAEQVADYETSYRLLEVTRTLVRPLMMVFVPIAAAMAFTSKQAELTRLVRRLITAVCLAGTALALICVAMAEPIVTTIWGENFRSGASIFAVLALSTIPLFLSMTCVQLAGALHRERDCLKILAPCALVNIVLNGFVIPHYGALG